MCSSDLGYFREALMLCDLCPNVYLDASSTNHWMEWQPGGLTLGQALRQALHGGEDYELLFTMPVTRRGVPKGCVRVGTIVPGKPGSVRLRGKPLPPRGYEHFSR